MDVGDSGTVTTVLWRRLDTPGHDACRLARLDRGWRLEGCAVFLHRSSAARLEYLAECDDDGRSTRGQVRGWVGSQAVEFEMRRSQHGEWTLNGAPTIGVGSALDLDFGFTPATNFFQIRRLALGVGQAAECPVAWFDVDSGALTLLHQRYERVGEAAYRYEAPRFGYAGMLELGETGLVRRYPGLWEAEQDG